MSSGPQRSCTDHNRQIHSRTWNLNFSRLGRQLLPVTDVLCGRRQGVESVLESHDLEGHVAGGQDEDADPANIHMEMRPASCAASSRVPFNEERLTRPNRRGGWRVATQAARTGLWMARQNLRGRRKDFHRTRLSSWHRCCS